MSRVWSAQRRQWTAEALGTVYHELVADSEDLTLPELPNYREDWERIAGRLQWATNRISEDPTSRQAAFPFWMPGTMADAIMHCYSLFHLIYRPMASGHGRLTLFVYMRSSAKHEWEDDLRFLRFALRCARAWLSYRLDGRELTVDPAMYLCVFKGSDHEYLERG